MAAENSDDEDVCRMIYSVAMTTGSEECTSEAGQRKAVGDIVGLSAEHRDFDAQEVLEGGVTEDVLGDTLRSRQYVFARVFEGGLLEEHDGDLYTAMNVAWEEVNDELPLYDEDDSEPDADDAEPDADEEADDVEVPDADPDSQEGDEEDIDEIIEEIEPDEAEA